MDQTTVLMTSMLFGAIGMGFMAYAKRQRDPVYLVTGIALCVFPYFVHSAWLSIAVGVLVIAFPFVLRRLA